MNADRDFSFRPMTSEDNVAIAGIIRRVMPEFGISGEGSAHADPEVDAMSEAYARPGHAYFVLESAGQVVGGAGVGPLAGGEPGICELRKMYFLPEARGQGQGRALLERCLQAARTLGYTHCYLETFHTMTAAQKLYARLGFERLPGPMGHTGHFKCSHHYLRPL